RHRLGRPPGSADRMRSRALILLAVALAAAGPARAALWIDAARSLDPVWSPDGTRIAFSRVTSTRDTLEVLDLRTGRTTALASQRHYGNAPVNVPPSTIAFNPSWSPDGTRLVYETYAQVQIVDVATRRRTGLGHGFEPVWGPADLIAVLLPADQYA